jgi:hypothetical protein
MAETVVMVDALSVGLNTGSDGHGGRGGQLKSSTPPLPPRGQNGLYRRSPVSFMQSRGDVVLANFGGGAFRANVVICETDLKADTSPQATFTGLIGLPGAQSTDRGYCFPTLAVHPSTPWCGLYVQAGAYRVSGGVVSSLGVFHVQAAYNKDTFELVPNGSGDLILGSGFNAGDFVTTADGVFFVDTNGAVFYYDATALPNFGFASTPGSVQSDSLTGAGLYTGFERHDHLSPGVIVIPASGGGKKLYDLNMASKTGGSGLAGVSLNLANPVPLNDAGTRYAGLSGSVVSYHGPEGDFTFDATTAPVPLSPVETGQTVPTFDLGQIVGTSVATEFIAVGIVHTLLPQTAEYDHYAAYVLSVSGAGLTLMAGPTIIATDTFGIII